MKVVKLGDYIEEYFKNSIKENNTIFSSQNFEHFK